MESQPTSTRPYLLRALFEWCGDNGLTPHIAVSVDDSVVVPRDFVKDGEIVLNISQDAAHGLHIDADAVPFKARFSGVARDIYVPIGRVIALFARENGQGMAFPPPVDNLEGAVSQDALPPQKDDGAADASASRAEAAAERSAPQLVPVGGAQSDETEGDAPPPKPPAGGGARPSLKLVK